MSKPSKRRFWKGLAAAGACLVIAGVAVSAGSVQTPGRIARFIDSSGNLGDSSIREDDAGNIAIGSNPKTEAKLLVNEGRLAVRSFSDKALGALVVSQHGSGPIATFRNQDKVVRLAVDADGMDLNGSFSVAGEEIIDASGRFVGEVDGVRKFNPLQVAAKKWYGANGTGVRTSVGNGPSDITFDGSYLWVANAQDGSISKIRPRDGVVEDTFSVGTNAFGVAYDGSHVWVAANNDGAIHKVRPSDGAIVATISTPGQPRFLAFDGTYLWASNHGLGTVMKIRAADAVLLDSYSTGGAPTQIEFDGTYLWVSNVFQASVARIRASDGAVDTIDVGQFPTGIAFDGSHVWVALGGESSVVKIDPATAAIEQTYSVGGSPSALVFDGIDLWVVREGFSSTVARIRRSDGAVVGVYDAGPFAREIAFDGIDLWVTNASDGAITRL